MIELSLIVPCYNEEDNVEIFFETAKNIFDAAEISVQYIFVDDGSKDDTLYKLKKIYGKDSEACTVISFSRNFGKEAAIWAGLKHAAGKMACIIDADLQQHPALVLEMMQVLEEHSEYDCVTAYQRDRHESKVLSFFKNIFYKLINATSEISFYPGASDFRLFRDYMVNAVLELSEYHRFSKGIFSWVGFQNYYFPYEVQQRNAGKSKWSFKKLLRYAMEGFASFTTFPLRISTYLGMISATAAIVYLLVVIIQKLIFGIAIPGYPTIICLILLLGGIQLLMLGIMGDYIARIFIQGKNRPIYIAKEILGEKNSERHEG